MWEVMVFLGGGKFWLMFKNYCQKSYVSTSFEGQKRGKNTMFGRYYLGQVGAIIWAKLVAGPDNNIQKFGCATFLFNKMWWNPYFIVFLTKC